MIEDDTYFMEKLHKYTTYLSLFSKNPYHLNLLHISLLDTLQSNFTIHKFFYPDTLLTLPDTLDSHGYITKHS